MRIEQPLAKVTCSNWHFMTALGRTDVPETVAELYQ
jgi:hypothetical protein